MVEDEAEGGFVGRCVEKVVPEPVVDVEKRVRVLAGVEEHLIRKRPGRERGKVKG